MLVPSLPIIILWRLVEAYENLLNAAGVSFYFMTIDGNNPRLREVLEKVLGLKPYAVETEADLIVYRRELKHGRISTITESA